MGHERVGLLPKTKKWNDLVRQVGSVYTSEFPVASIAATTLQNVRKRYEALFRDDTVKEVFAFLVTFSRACRFPNTSNELKNSGIFMSEQPTPLSIIKALHQRVPKHEATSEYGQLALAAAADAIGQWHKQHSTIQMPMFKPSPEFFESWRDLGKGAGFCELARLYFGKLTERYLNYFLDRAASAKLPNIQQRDRLQHDIKKYIDDISKHAFETAKITQSFAAGWFTAHTREGLPDPQEIEGFLAIAFGKLRDELRREEETE
jgi:hypothetical protein